MADARTRVLRGIQGVLVTLMVWAVLCTLVLFLVWHATREHWTLGLGVTIFYVFAAYLGLTDLRSREARKFPVHKGLFIFLLTGLTGIAVAASVSWQLLRAGWAVYDPVPSDDDAYQRLITYYVWVFLDMLPAVKANELLVFAPPLKPSNSAAGIPVVAFRAFVFLGLLTALRVWWQGRKQPAHG